MNVLHQNSCLRLSVADFENQMFEKAQQFGNAIIVFQIQNEMEFEEHVECLNKTVVMWYLE